MFYLFFSYFKIYVLSFWLMWYMCLVWTSINYLGLYSCLSDLALLLITFPTKEELHSIDSNRILGIALQLRLYYQPYELNFVHWLLPVLISTARIRIFIFKYCIDIIISQIQEDLLNLPRCKFIACFFVFWIWLFCCGWDFRHKMVWFSFNLNHINFIIRLKIT